MTHASTESALAARVARRHYLQNQSKSEIAVDLGISRFRVARLLDAARRDGLVTFEVHVPDHHNPSLSEELRCAFDLQHSVVVDAPDVDLPGVRTALGAGTAQLLTQVLSEGDVLGIAWARSLQDVASSLTRVAPCPVVQLTGALLGPDGSDVLDMVRHVAKVGGGTPYVYYAPLVAPDAASARLIRRQPDVIAAYEAAQRVSVAIVGCGAWDEGLSTIFDSIDPPTRAQVADAGAIGEISGVLIDASGRPVDCLLSHRIIGLTAPQLSQISTVISTGYELGKAPLILAALTGGFVNGLVVTSTLAQTLLDLRRTASDALPS